MKPICPTAVLLLFLLSTSPALAARKRPRASHAVTQRDESTPDKCRRHEYHVICGPERHCERACDNLFSPPYCAHDDANPKCFFPRCLCLPGYVRNERGRCVRPSHCQANTLDEAMGKTSDDALAVSAGNQQPKPSLVHSSRHGKHEARHQRRARHFLHHKHSKENDGYFW